MSTYTNVEINNPASSHNRKNDLIKHNELTIKILQERVDSLYDALLNIPEAVKEFGYVNIWYENQTIRLIKNPEEEKDGTD